MKLLMGGTKGNWSGLGAIPSSSLSDLSRLHFPSVALASSSLTQQDVEWGGVWGVGLVRSKSGLQVYLWGPLHTGREAAPSSTKHHLLKLPSAVSGLDQRRPSDPHVILPNSSQTPGRVRRHHIGSGPNLCLRRKSSLNSMISEDLAWWSTSG